MKSLAIQMWKEDEGVLTFEWILLVTLLTIGIVSGLSTARDAIISELDDVAQAMMALDQSYTIDFPLVSSVHIADSTSASDSAFTPDRSYFEHCSRGTLAGQTPTSDCAGHSDLFN